MVLAEVHRLAEKLAPLPTHEVLRDLGRAALAGRVIGTGPYKKVVAFLLDSANGRDRREPWSSREGDVRPVPDLRIALEECFGVYADVHWFNLNKTANASGHPLLGLFPRMGATLAKVNVDDLAALVAALLTETPDAALLRLLQERGGRVPGVGVEVFSRLAFAHRRDLYFTIPKAWGEASGCFKFVGDDLRRYCELCRNLRTVCDDLGFPAPVRGSVLHHLLSLPHPPAELLAALHHAIGPSLSRFSALEPADAYEIPDGNDDLASLPMEFAAKTLRARRGERRLRQKLLKAGGDRCALTGSCLRDLLEVAYVLPFPTGEPHAPEAAFLVRSDVHTLWDLNLIGVEPSSRRVNIAPRLRETIYGKLAGRILARSERAPELDPSALEERWRLFISAHPDADAGRADAGRTDAGRPESSPPADATDSTGEAEPPTVVVRRKRRKTATKAAPADDANR